MPPKIRQLVKILQKAGFSQRKGKGSHRVYRHPNGTIITLSGQPGQDAKPYQVLQVRDAIEQMQNENH